MARTARPEPPEQPVYIEVAEYQIDGSVGEWFDDGKVHCHVMWRVLQPGTPIFFWMRDLDWFPDVHGIYEWSKGGGLIAAPTTVKAESFLQTPLD